MNGPEDAPIDGPEGADEVGGVGEEAAKLFGALSDWARDQGDQVVPGPGGLGGLGGLGAAAAAAAAGVTDHVNERLATGSAECAYCPVCRTVHALRQTSPEVRTHLAAAASSLLQAAAGFLATLPQTGATSPRASGFEKIDLDQPDDPEQPDQPHRTDDPDGDPE